MAGLKGWEELPFAAVVSPKTAPKQLTGSWRTGVRPLADLSLCVNCLLCWIHCPDAAIVLEGESFAGFDERFCKGCELCAVACPTGAITMVAEDTPMPKQGVTRNGNDR